MKYSDEVYERKLDELRYNRYGDYSVKGLRSWTRIINFRYTLAWILLPFTLVLAGPIYVLYFFSLMVAWLAESLEKFITCPFEWIKQRRRWKSAFDAVELELLEESEINFKDE